MYTALTQHTGNIVWIAVICLISIGVGKLALAWANMKNSDSGETIIFSAAVGFALIGYSIFIVGICQMLYSIVIYFLTAIYATLALAGWFIGKKRQIDPPRLQKIEHFENMTSNGRLLLAVNRFCLITLGICMLLCVILVLTPEIGKDALIYRIGVPKLFLEHHGIYFIPGNIFASYPFFNEMLYTWGLSLGGGILPKGTHFAIAVFILFTMWKFGRRYVQKNNFELLPLLIFFTIPSVFQNAHVAYCDLTLAFYTFVAIYAYLNWYNTQENLWIILCGVFSGIAMSTKYAGLYLPISGCFGVLWGCRQKKISNSKAVRLLFQYVLFTLITGAPFYLKNWIMTGNPLYPLFYEIFAGRGWSAEQAGYYDTFIRNLGMGRDLVDYLLLPWNLSFYAKINNPIFDGLIGPVFILVLPFAIGMRKVAIEMKIVWVYCILAFCFWASSAQQIRYLIPLFPFLAIMVSLTISYYRNNKKIFTLLSIFIIVGLVFNGYHILRDFKRIRPLGVFTGHENKDAFLTRIIPSYEIIRHVNTQLPEKSYVFTIYMKNLTYLFDRPFYSDSMFESYTIETILNNSKTPEDVRLALKKKGFTHILYDINYVMGDDGTFSEENKALFTAFQNKYLTLKKSDKRRYFLYGFEELENTPES
jgi:hypothetical protein